jgi:hypothetical protein
MSLHPVDLAIIGACLRLTLGIRFWGLATGIADQPGALR